MAAGFFGTVHRHKEVVAVRCEDCGAWINYQPAEYHLKAVRKLTRQLAQRLNQTVSDTGRARTLQNKTNDGGRNGASE